MDDDFVVAVREFLNEVSASAVDEIERAVRSGQTAATTVTLRIAVSSEDVALQRVYETTIEVPPPAPPEAAAMF